jgi:hypothetical protein
MKQLRCGRSGRKWIMNYEHLNAPRAPEVKHVAEKGKNIMASTHHEHLK